MDNVKQYEKEQYLNALNQAIDFLNHEDTQVELANETLIGKKYIATRGQDTKEIDVTYGNTMIVSFTRGYNFVSRIVIYHDIPEVKSKVKTMTNRLEKAVSGKSFTKRFSYYWKRFKELQH